MAEGRTRAKKSSTRHFPLKFAADDNSPDIKRFRSDRLTAVIKKGKADTLTDRYGLRAEDRGEIAGMTSTSPQGHSSRKDKVKMEGPVPESGNSRGVKFQARDRRWEDCGHRTYVCLFTALCCPCLLAIHCYIRSVRRGVQRENRGTSQTAGSKS